MESLPADLQSIISRGKDDIDLFARELLGITLHPGQIKFLRSQAKINVLVPANRYGKTTSLAVKHIHKSFYKVGVPRGNMKAWQGAAYMTCALAPHSQQAEVILQTIEAILTSTFSFTDDEGNPITNNCKIGWFLLSAQRTYPMQITYAFNSKTLIRSTGEDKGKSIAAKAFGYIGYDEAGQSLHLEEELESILLPRLADYNGTIDLVGTPDASSPSFVYYQEMFWRGGGDGNPKQPEYYSQEGSAKDNIYLPKAYFDEMVALYGNSPRLQQVLYGKFISVGNKVFDHVSIIKASRDMEDYIPYQAGHRYIIAIDTAIGEDELVITVLDWTELPLEVAKIIAGKGNAKSPQFHLQDIMDTFYHYNQGETCSMILETFNGESMRYYYDLPADIKAKTRCFGSGRPIGVVKRAGNVDRKEDILLAARKVLDNGEVVFSNKHRKLIQQLANYTQDDQRIKTDWTISFCLACFYATDGQPKSVTLTPVSISW